MTVNPAGHSAQEMARRAREKAERLHRSAAAWETGAVGEQATGEVLARLDPSRWTTLHDVKWPGRQRANIDHVVIGPPGVFVIDSKNWSGAVSVTDGVLRQNGRSREKAVAGVAEAGLAVLSIVPDVPVHPVLCLVRDESVSGWVRDVMLCSTNNLDVMIQSRPRVLSDEAVQRAVAKLGAGLAGSGGARRRARAVPTAVTPPRTRRRGRPSGLRVLAGLTMMLLLVGALQSGLLTSATSLIGEQIAGLVVDEEPSPTPAKKKARRDRERNDRGAGDRRS